MDEEKPKLGIGATESNYKKEECDLSYINLKMVEEKPKLLIAATESIYKKEEFDLPYIDKKLEELFGHLYKDFQGPIAEENLGAKYGDSGSFLPMYFRVCSIHASLNLKRPTKKSTRPKSLLYDLFDEIEKNSKLEDNGKAGSSRKEEEDKIVPDIDSKGIIEENNELHEDKKAHSSKKEHKIDPDVHQHIENEVQNFLGHCLKDFDGSIHAETNFTKYGSFLPTHEESEGTNIESPTIILKEMTSLPVPEDALISPLYDILSEIFTRKEEEKVSGNCGFESLIEEHVAMLADEHNGKSQKRIGKMSSGEMVREQRGPNSHNDDLGYIGENNKCKGKASTPSNANTNRSKCKKDTTASHKQIGKKSSDQVHDGCNMGKELITNNQSNVIKGRVKASLRGVESVVTCTSHSDFVCESELPNLKAHNDINKSRVVHRDSLGTNVEHKIDWDVHQHIDNEVQNGYGSFLPTHEESGGTNLDSPTNILKEMTSLPVPKDALISPFYDILSDIFTRKEEEKVTRDCGHEPSIEEHTTMLADEHNGKIHKRIGKISLGEKVREQRRPSSHNDDLGYIGGKDKCKGKASTPSNANINRSKCKKDTTASQKLIGKKSSYQVHDGCNVGKKLITENQSNVINGRIKTSLRGVESVVTCTSHSDFVCESELPKLKAHNDINKSRVVDRDSLGTIVEHKIDPNVHQHIDNVVQNGYGSFVPTHEESGGTNLDSPTIIMKEMTSLPVPKEALISPFYDILSEIFTRKEEEKVTGDCGFESSIEEHVAMLADEHNGKSQKQIGKMSSGEMVREQRGPNSHNDDLGYIGENNKCKGKASTPSNANTNRSKCKKDTIASQKQIGKKSSDQVHDGCNVGKELITDNMSNVIKGRINASLRVVESLVTCTSHSDFVCECEFPTLKAHNDINKSTVVHRDSLGTNVEQTKSSSKVKQPKVNKGNTESANVSKKGSTRDSLQVVKNDPGGYGASSCKSKTHKLKAQKDVNKSTSIHRYSLDTTKETERDPLVSSNDVEEGEASDETSELILEDWVACDRCQTWRLLPFGMKANQLPEKWQCSMLDWLPGKNRCDVSEQETTKSLYALYELPVSVSEGENSVQYTTIGTISKKCGLKANLKSKSIMDHLTPSPSDVMNHFQPIIMKRKKLDISDAKHLKIKKAKIDANVVFNTKAGASMTQTRRDNVIKKLKSEEGPSETGFGKENESKDQKIEARENENVGKDQVLCKNKKKVAPRTNFRAREVPLAPCDSSKNSSCLKIRANFGEVKASHVEGVSLFPFKTSFPENLALEARRKFEGEKKHNRSHMVTRSMISKTIINSESKDKNGARHPLSPRSMKPSNQKATNVLKEAKDLRDAADRFKSYGFDFECNEAYFQAALKFLHGAWLLESCSSESDIHGEIEEMYITTAKLCEFCAHQFERHGEMTTVALAYKCIEISYMRIIFYKHHGASRDRNEMQAMLNTVLQGEFTSSSASGLDNSNNQGAASISHATRKHAISIRNNSNIVQLLEYLHYVEFAMDASTKSRNALTASIVSKEEDKNKECINSVQAVMDFSFQDIEELLRLVQLARDAINSLRLCGAKD